ncbi:hypothetical protein [Silvibacterium dinghuense]|uniref:Uncharacterized protein n=1 Tax=Silvibacterium dinghuense TaxID=1560006 RepID=A0A4Q1SJF9_9BACT|nr:hypothetical protein [Silvibacterium dinghuense]RXS97766.1 hypothetical protein ESZ00_07860 [Silvibacterium dinghuense]GGH01846.1 hypothetical protein GCM10011586_16920 [Silvibacterium dinghuense]
MSNSRPAEPLHVSSRFRDAVLSAALKLEQQASLDERHVHTLTDPDHRRRHRRLVDEQLIKAFRLREMIKLMRVREPQPMPPLRNVHFVPTPSR